MPKRVLVAEDNWPAGEILVRFLRHAGHVAVAVSDGMMAWELLNQGEAFDLVMSDYDMPGLTGLDLLRRVRGDERTAKTPFVLMSGRVTVSSRDQTGLEEVCAKLGAVFVAKPFFDFEELIERMLGATVGN